MASLPPTVVMLVDACVGLGIGLGSVISVSLNLTLWNIKTFLFFVFWCCLGIVRTYFVFLTYLSSYEVYDT